MKNLDFWKKTSNYTTILCGVACVLLLFFKKYLQKGHIAIILIAGAIVLLISLLSELMKFIIKRKNNE